jgi:hypothetical protein
MKRAKINFRSFFVDYLLTITKIYIHLSFDYLKLEIT